MPHLRDVSEVDLLQVGAAPRTLASTRATGSLAVLPPVVLFQAAQRTGGDLRLVVRAPAASGVAVVVFRGGQPTMVFLPGDGRSLGELMLATGDIDIATLDALVEGRARTAAGLEELLLERTKVPVERIRRLLDFQGRQRLLEVLSWREGFFELQDYRGGGETAFHLELPGTDSLAYRAEARSRALPGLLERLPATPANTLVRRRRGGEKPQDQLGREIVTHLDEPLLLGQLVARMLVDDDLLIDRVLRLAEAKTVALQPRAALAALPGRAPGPDPRLAAVLREAVARTRGQAAAAGTVTLSVVVIAAAADGARFVVRLGAADGAAGASTGVASRMVDLGDGARVCLLAIRPEALSRGALEGVLARLDALVLLRCSSDAAELERLQQLRAVVRAGSGERALLTVGIDLGSALRDWGEYPDAVLGLSDWDARPAGWLVERLVEALLAATAARAV